MRMGLIVAVRIMRLLMRTEFRSISQLISQLISQSISQLISQSISQLNSESINQLISQSTSRLVVLASLLLYALVLVFLLATAADSATLIRSHVSLDLLRLIIHLSHLIHLNSLKECYVE